MPTKKFADGAEIFEHCQRHRQALRPLRRRDLLHPGARRCAGTRRSSAGGSAPTAATTSAPASWSWRRAPTTGRSCPASRASRTSTGHVFHSARWDYDYTGGDANGGLDKLADKRVALVGTGATGVQLVPHLGRDAKQLYVFQRTPSSVDVRGNKPTDPEWAKSLQPGWQEERKRNFHSWSPFEGVVFGEPDLVCDFWTELGRNLTARIAASRRSRIAGDRADHGDPRGRGLQDHGAAAPPHRRASSTTRTPPRRSSRITGSCASGRARNDDYLPTFNRPNVTLVDVSESKGVERITEKGIVADGVEYEVDCVDLRQRLRDLHRDQPPVRDRRDRGPRRPVALRPLARRLQDAARDDQPRLPQPVLHRLHPGRRLGQHHRDVRAAGRAHRLHHRRGAEARGDDRRAQPGRPGRLGQDHPGTGDRQLGVRTRPARRAITTTRAAVAEKASGRSSASSTRRLLRVRRPARRSGATKATSTGWSSEDENG